MRLRFRLPIPKLLDWGERLIEIDSIDEDLATLRLKPFVEWRL
jgi:hypothetical protein